MGASSEHCGAIYWDWAYLYLPAAPRPVKCHELRPNRASAAEALSRAITRGMHPPVLCALRAAASLPLRMRSLLDSAESALVPLAAAHFHGIILLSSRSITAADARRNIHVRDPVRLLPLARHLHENFGSQYHPCRRAYRHDDSG